MKDSMENFSKVLFDVFIMVARFTLILIVYKTVFTWKGGEIYGTTFEDVVWSMFLYFAFMNLNPRYISRYIQQDIQTGRIQDILVKPFSYIYYRLFSHLGSKLYSSVINIFLFTSFMVFSVGVTENMLRMEFFIGLIFTSVFGYILSFLIYMSVGMLAFWMEDTLPVLWIVDKFVMVLGGSYLPIVFFPDFMKTLAVWSPFGASQFISHIVYVDWKFIYLKMIGIQIIWIFIFALLLYSIFNVALKRVVTNGG